MPGIMPFRAIRYAARGPALGGLLAPPDDCITAAQRSALVSRSPHNAVHLIAGEEPAAGVGPETRYLRAGNLFREWLGGGVLQRDPRPALYRLEQSFEAEGGRHLIRRGVLAAVRLHDYRDGVVVPHAGTVPATRAHLLARLEQVGANLSPILGLHSDPRNESLRLLAEQTPTLPVAEALSDDRVHHRLWRIEDPEAVACFQRFLADQRVLIADGHHRYEAALAYRDLLDSRRPGLYADGGHRYVLMCLCSMNDPGMLIYPTHRLVDLPDVDLSHLQARLERFFTVETLPEDIHRPAGLAWAISRMAEHLGRSTAFVMVSTSDGKARILVQREDVEPGQVGLPGSKNLRALDVNVLHALVLRFLLELSPEREQRLVRYVKDAGEAVARVLSGEASLAFLLNPTPMWQVQAAGEVGETMPQKSTSFYPRIPTGLAFREVDPMGPA
jgi:uncharacterized protein (DUF1015 family)